MLEKIKKGLFPPGIEEYKVDFAYENSQSLLFMLIAGMSVSTAALLLQLWTGYHFVAYGRAIEYMIFFGMSIAIYLTNVGEISRKGTGPLYVWVGLLLAWNIQLTAANDTDYPVFVFMFLMMFLPLLIRDAFGHVLIFVLAFAVFFAVIDAATRPESLFYADLIHLIMVVVAVCYMSHRLIHDRIEFMQHSANAETKAEHDVLTGIYNRRGGELMIRNYIATGVTGAFVMIDVDNFKHVNDTYGHKRGDEVLELVAKTLSQNFRESDVVMRMGGDEFIVYVVGMADVRNAATKLESVRNAFHSIVLDESLNDYVTVSMGCMINLGSYPDYESLSQAADKLLYMVKTGGKDNFKISDVDYDPVKAAKEKAADPEEKELEKEKS